MYQKFLKFFKENSKLRIMLKYDGLRKIKRYSIMFMDQENADNTRTNETDMPMEVFSDFFYKYTTNPIENINIKFYISDIWMRFYNKTIQLFGDDAIAMLLINDSVEGKWFFVGLVIGKETYYKNGLSLNEMNFLPDNLSLNYLSKRGGLSK